MVQPPRAYITPGEYCVFYLHNRRIENGASTEDYQNYKMQIGKDTKDALRAALTTLGKGALYAQIDSFQINVNRIHTIDRLAPIDPAQPEKSLLSLVVLELLEPMPNVSWDAFIQEIYSDGTNPNPHLSGPITTLSMYNQLRVDILKTVMDIYNPGDAHYQDPLEYASLQTPVDIDNQRNVSFYGQQKTIRDTLLANNIVAISPNWLVAPASNSPPPVDSGGPGAEPDIATPTNTASLNFVALDGSTPWWQSSNGGDNVHVAIFDSIPDIVTIKDAHDVLAQSPTNPGFKLFSNLFGPAPISSVPTSLPDIGDIHELPNLTLIYDGAWNALPPLAAAASTATSQVPNTTIAKHNYEMSDHGSFIGGIIRSIVPNAHIYLIQVLNKLGIGNLESVWCGFVRYWNYLRAKYEAEELGHTSQQQISMLDMINSMKMVFNCSLAFDTPPMQDLSELELPVLTTSVEKTHNALFYDKVVGEMRQDEIFNTDLSNVIDSRQVPGSNSQIAYAATVMTQLWPSFDGLRYLFSDQFFGINRIDDAQGQPNLTNLHILAAAAGNNCEVGGLHPAAQYPASDPLVVGVGALQMTSSGPIPADDEQIADYSNLADTPMQTGFYVFGGTAPGQTAGTTTSAPRTTAGQGIVGLFLDKLPSGGIGTGAGEGLAEWAGTSFAAPIVSGILAGLLGDGDNLPLQTLHTTLQGRTAIVEKTEAQVPITQSGTYDPVTMQIIQLKQDR